MNQPIILSLAIAVVSLQSAHAATLAQYNFTGDTLTPTTLLPGITATDMSDANTSGGAFNTAHSGPSGTPNFRMVGIQELTPTDYFSFTTDATASLNSVTYETFDFYQNAATSSQTPKYAVSYFISGGSEVFIETGTTASTNTGVGNMLHTVINFSDFTTSQSVEWRIYGYDAGNAADAFRVDDVAVTGTLVPEPTTAMLLLGWGGLLAFRRRRI